MLQLILSAVLYLYICTPVIAFEMESSHSPKQGSEKALVQAPEKAPMKEAIQSPSEVQSQEDLPLWEAGILGGLVDTADYPGSNESEFRWLVFPNFRYRGEILRSEETEGTRARLYNDPTYRIDLSFDFNFPIDSSENEARLGMEDVDLVFEIGPRARIRLMHWEDLRGSLFFLFPLRKAVTVDFWNLGDAGWSMSPGFQYSQLGVFCDRCLGFFRVNVSLFDKKNSDTFYAVDLPDVTPTRPQFIGKPGFNSLEFFLGYVLLVGQMQGFLGVIHNEYGGSVNRDSPLLTAERNTTIILGLGWLFWQSEKKGYK